MSTLFVICAFAPANHTIASFLNSSTRRMPWLIETATVSSISIVIFSGINLLFIFGGLSHPVFIYSAAIPKTPSRYFIF